jgi:hypothetical protein
MTYAMAVKGLIPKEKPKLPTITKPQPKPKPNPVAVPRLEDICRMSRAAKEAKLNINTPSTSIGKTKNNLAESQQINKAATAVRNTVENVADTNSTPTALAARKISIDTCVRTDGAEQQSPTNPSEVKTPSSVTTIDNKGKFYISSSNDVTTN